ESGTGSAGVPAGARCSEASPGLRGTVAPGTTLFRSGGTLSGTATHAAVGGVATFAGLSIDKTGTGYTLTAGSGTLTGTSSDFSITGGTAGTPPFTVQPPSTAAPASIQPAIQAPPPHA